MTANNSLLRQPGESRTTPAAALEPAELVPGYGWCDLHQGNAWIAEPTALDSTTGLHGACRGCVDGRVPTRRLDPPALFPSA